MTKEFHYVYQTINLINKKTYIGVHTTCNLNDGYKGSGLHLLRAFKKYGKHNFSTQIMSFFDTREEAFEKEAWLVTDEWTKSSSNYNLDLGGFGGSGFRGKKHSEYNIKKWSEQKKGITPTKAILKRSKGVYCGHLGKEFKSISDCARELGCSQSYLSQILSGRCFNKYKLIKM